MWRDVGMESPSEVARRGTGMGVSRTSTDVVARKSAII
jgi:hypothetical protein